MSTATHPDHPHLQLCIEHPCRRDRRLTVHELDDEALIYDAESANTHRLNATAYFIWRQCDGRRNVSAVAHRMCDVYEVDFRAAVKHVTRILREFVDHGLVEEATQCLQGS